MGGGCKREMKLALKVVKNLLPDFDGTGRILLFTY